MKLKRRDGEGDDVRGDCRSKGRGFEVNTGGAGDIPDIWDRSITMVLAFRASSDMTVGGSNGSRVKTLRKAFMSDNEREMH